MMHNKVSSEKFHKEISDKTDGYIWEDVSWGNDECDSIFCENIDIQIFFPSEDWATFNVVTNCDRGPSEGFEYDSIEEVIEFINNIEN